MMKHVAFLACVVVFFRPYSGKGIEFETKLSLEQIFAKASKERKYIFIDCYASWCAPCKLMEKKIFSKQDVGDFMNGHFICIRVQIDTSVFDDELTKKYYNDARFLASHFKIKEFPTYLFFSPDGKIVHRACGFLRDSLFLSVATEAMDSNSQYCRNLDKFNLGQIEYKALPKLANQATLNHESALANTIANKYLHLYLDSLNDFNSYSSDDFNFMKSFYYYNLSTRDRAFDLLFHNTELIDFKFKSKNWSESILDRAIEKDYIEMYKDVFTEEALPGDLPWKKFYRSIRSRFGKQYADRVIVNAKLKWYRKKGKWNEITKYTIMKMDKYGFDTSGLGKAFVNNTLYLNIFAHSNNRKELQKAADWMRGIVSGNPDDREFIDTYANLLYKLGKSSKAITWEEKATMLEDSNAVRQKRVPDSIYNVTLTKMRKHQPTW